VGCTAGGRSYTEGMTCSKCLGEVKNFEISLEGLKKPTGHPASGPASATFRANLPAT